MHSRAQKRLAADRQVRGHLPGAVLKAKPRAGFLPDHRRDAWGVAACGGRLAPALELLGPAAASSAVAAKFTADGGGVAVE
jgi:hypothetical protein